MQQKYLCQNVLQTILIGLNGITSCKVTQGFLPYKCFVFGDQKFFEW